MKLERSDIAQRIPHAGAMCLLDGVLDWDGESIRCVAHTHLDAANPLRSHDRLAVICGIEYAAQAMALHGSLCAKTASRPRSGYLAVVRECAWTVARLDDLPGELTIVARQLYADGLKVLYEFDLSCQKSEILRGRAAVVLDAPPRGEQSA
jgi:predicted hotdog family 3-hydroxylacyl-ACP dehydratase